MVDLQVGFQQVVLLQVMVHLDLGHWKISRISIKSSWRQESLLESLRQAFGPHGFLPEVVELLHSPPQLPEAAAEQLKIQCLLSLRLAAAWETPSSVQKPLELVLQQKLCWISR